MIPAADAERVGIVNRVVPAAELDGEVDALVARLLTMAPVALSQTKHLLDQAMSTTFEDAVVAVARHLAEHVLEAAPHLAGDRIHRVGPVERERHHAVATVDQQIRHGPLP